MKCEIQKRKSIKIRFPASLNEIQFEQIAVGIAKRIKRLYVKTAGGTIYGIVTTVSGLDTWSFELDFNDYGHLTGNYYFNSCDNMDSTIPTVYAERVKQAILEYL